MAELGSNRSSVICDDENDLLKIEAEGAVREISFAVKHVEISKSLPSSQNVVFLNLKTKEDESICVELSVKGFRIIGKIFDHIDESKASPFYETIYALLDNCSPGYRNTFGETLFSRLQQLQSEDQGETTSKDSSDS
ncbi:GSK3B-interacting protein-like [Gigantopelta aegis]|uniref:GSK3B-interacting protein-like n=1 Tax=Gigantopelta aegis TaxID=1735272 RepID=UPI001B8874B2|nr:GSK3B-interacting protein-like [Gigantopelta aegis]